MIKIISWRAIVLATICGGLLFYCIVIWSKWGRLEVNDYFRYPYLGEVNCHSETKVFNLANADGSRKVPMEFKVFRAPDGQFLRAQMYNERPKRSLVMPLNVIQEDLASEGMVVTGIAEIKEGPSIEKILSSIAHKTSFGAKPLFGGAARCDITRVKFKWADRPEAIVYIVNLWDTDDGFFAGINKGRYVLKEDFSVWFFDNVL